MTESKILISDLRGAREDGGELLGFYAKGHHDRYEFAMACNVYNGVNSEYDRRFVHPDQCRHVWWRSVPMAGEPGCMMFIDATPNSRGSYPATVWDGLADEYLYRARASVREFHRGKCQGIAAGVNWGLSYVEAKYGLEAGQLMADVYRERRDKIEGEPL